LVTVKVYVPSVRFGIAVLIPDPVVVTPPGVRIRVQDPDGGNPPKDTLPVDTVHVGMVTVPTTGAVGADDNTLIVTLADAAEMQFAAFKTVYV
jgi:hypothetical protein